MYWESIHQMIINNIVREVIGKTELKIKPAPKRIPKRLWLKLASLFVSLETEFKSYERA